MTQPVDELQNAELNVCCPACGWVIRLRVALDQFVPRGLFKPSDKASKVFLKGMAKFKKRK